MSTRDYLEKDYYATLGVAKDADADAIKKAYRTLARKHHPDANADDPSAEEKFKEVSEAYDVLSDDAKRREYDEMRAYGAAGFAGGPGGPFTGGGPFAGGYDTVNLEDLFGGSGLGATLGGLFGGRSPRGSRARKGADLEAEVTVDFRQAFDGTVLPLRVTSDGACHTCGGTGAKPGTSPHSCPVCNGSGQSVREQGGFAFAEACRSCHGRGVVVDEPCPTCRGVGVGQQTRTVQVRLPAGVKDGARIRVKGRGGAGQGGAPTGDLFVKVHVRRHAVFGRRGDNLTLAVPITFPEAALGATVSVPTIDGDVVMVKIPAGTPSGRTLRVRGRGVTRKDGSRGDLLATVDVAVPQRLDGDARKALQQFAEVTDDHDPRADLIANAAKE
ncbi:MAG: molecular chaperone DnaJ [Actinomycetes bacterium]